MTAVQVDQSNSSMRDARDKRERRDVKVESKVEYETRWRVESESPTDRRMGQRIRVEVSSQATTPSFRDLMPGRANNKKRCGQRLRRWLDCRQAARSGKVKVEVKTERENRWEV